MKKLVVLLFIIQCTQKLLSQVSRSQISCFVYDLSAENFNESDCANRLLESVHQLGLWSTKKFGHKTFECFGDRVGATQMPERSLHFGGFASINTSFYSFTRTLSENQFMRLGNGRNANNWF